MSEFPFPNSTEALKEQNKHLAIVNSCSKQWLEIHSLTLLNIHGTLYYTVQVRIHCSVCFLAIFARRLMFWWGSLLHFNILMLSWWIWQTANAKNRAPQQEGIGLHRKWIQLHLLCPFCLYLTLSFTTKAKLILSQTCKKYLLFWRQSEIFGWLFKKRSIWVWKLNVYLTS